MPQTDYLREARRVGNGWEWWLEQGLFNRLRLAEYVALLRAHFAIDRIAVIGSREAERYRREHPDTWAQLRERHAELDLRVKIASVIGRLRAAQTSP